MKKKHLSFYVTISQLKVLFGSWMNYWSLSLGTVSVALCAVATVCFSVTSNYLFLIRFTF